jgi:phytoene desaturase
MHLAGAGRRVTVLEAESTPGGSAARVSLPATGGGTYHLDTGPTVLTMPDLLADCFAALGESMPDWVTLRRLDPAYRAQFADGTGLSVTSDVEAMTERIRVFSGTGGSGGGVSGGNTDADGYRRYVELVTRLYRLQMRDLIDRNFDSPVDLLGSSLAKLVALRGFSRLAPTVARYFRDERLQRVFSFQAMYAGVSPARALAIYAVISYMDLVEGVFYPVGGMNALPTAMEAAARKAGVEVVYDTKVTGATWSGDRVIEVRSLDGRAWPADAVVMTLDRPAAFEVLDRTQRRSARHPVGRTARTRYSPSCVVLAAGAEAQWPPDAAHHTMHFGRAWSEVFDDLDAGRLMRDPSFLLSLPSVTDPGLAPAGSSAAYVLFPAPNLDHEQPLDWARLRGPYREHMLNTVENAGYRGFGEAIDAELLITPQDWAERGLGAGTPFAAAHTFGQTGPFRSPNTLGDNVVFAGASTTPGVGVPMVLISGRLAAERLTGHDPAYRSLAWR